jgi:hypothetical protein
MAKKISVEHAVRWLATERLTARLELAVADEAMTTSRVNLVVYDGDDVMGRLEIDGGFLDEGADGVWSMIDHVDQQRQKLTLQQLSSPIPALFAAGAWESDDSVSSIVLTRAQAASIRIGA